MNTNVMPNVEPKKSELNSDESTVILPDLPSGKFSGKSVYAIVEKNPNVKKFVLGNTNIEFARDLAIKTIGTRITSANKILSGLDPKLRATRLTTGKTAGKSRIGFYCDPEKLTVVLFAVENPVIHATVDFMNDEIRIPRNVGSQLIHASTAPITDFSKFVEYDRATEKPYATGFSALGFTSAKDNVIDARADIIAKINASYIDAINSYAIATANQSVNPNPENEKIANDANEKMLASQKNLIAIATAQFVKTGESKFSVFVEKLNAELVKRATESAKNSPKNPDDEKSVIENLKKSANEIRVENAIRAKKPATEEEKTK